MIRKALLILCFLFPTILFSQTLGNEWINYGQAYYRFKVTEKGIYRIHKQVLINAGIPIDAINPKNIQIYGKEQELSIYIQGEEDGSFDENDFIEFLAEGNNGWMDSLLYVNPADMLNPEYSLINDTLNYYLTWNNSTNNRRAIPENGQNFDTYPSSPFCWVTKKTIFNNHYLFGKRAGQIQNPRYTTGEGYGFSRPWQTLTIDFNTTNRITGLSVPEATFTGVFASTNNPSPGIPQGNHHLKLQVQGQTIFDEIFLGFENFRVEQTIDPLTLENTSKAVIGAVNDIGLTANDSYAMGFAQLTFAHNFNFENEPVFEFDATSNPGFEKLKIEFEALAGTNPIVYTAGNQVYRTSPSPNGSGFRFLIPQNGEETIRCFISSSENIKEIGVLTAVNSTGFFTDFKSQNLANAFVIISSQTLMESAMAYTAYRNGKFNVLLVDVEELYDQYGGGVKKHPMSIKRFMADLLQNWDEAPANLFLFGKSISQRIFRRNPVHYVNCLVPTIGAPESDNLFTAGLNGTLLQTAVPVGRIAAKDNESALAYLDKVILFEAQQPQTWMKQMLFFGGGGTTSEQSTFANYLRKYEITASDTSFGAHVNTVLKNTSAPIQINVSEAITERINAGVSMMSFFGHAFGSGFDINIDSPDKYENYGKYPLTLASSCFIGNIHTNGFSNSEEFVLIPEKGSIAYIASTTTGVAAYLDAFNKKFYKHMFQSDYGKSIGSNLSRAVSDIQGNGADPLMIANCLEMSIHGDPSLVLNSFEKPDFATSDGQVFFEPEELTADIDSFKVNIVMDNPGKATYQKFGVELIRHFPQTYSGDSIYLQTVTGLLNTDTISFTLAAEHAIADGLNTFDITLDVFDQVDEIDNIGNNKVYGKEFFIKSSQIVPLYPFDQSIIGEQQPYLSASTGDLKSSTATYRFQFSNRPDFSENLFSGDVVQSGGVVKWQVPILLNSETVYYWRIAEISDADAGNWRNTSFEYIPNKTGWGQSSPEQLAVNQFDLLDYNVLTNNLSFLQGSKNLTCKLFGSSPANFANEVKLDLDIVDYAGCGGGPWVFVMVFDKNTLEPWGTNYDNANPEHEFGNVKCNSRSRVEYFFAFNQLNADNLDALYNMLSVEIPNGNHILVYSYTYSRFDKWSEFKPALFTLFQNLGSELIDVNAPNNVPFIFYAQKGNPETAVEEMGQNNFDVLYINQPLPITGNNGKIIFNGGGFTSKINKVSWRFTEPDANDAFKFNIFQDQSVLFESDEHEGIAAESLQSNPYSPLSGDFKLADTADFTPLQFDYFRIFYSAVGDAALNPNEVFEFESDTLQEGEPLRFKIAITNPTPYSMDSLMVRYSIIDIFNNPVRVVDRKLDSLSASATLIDEFDVESFGLSGKNRLVYQINPLSNNGNPEQPEQHRFNNEISLSFFVKKDDTQPILDVVFDGMHIMDGEIVSPKPNVVVSLKDENTYLVFEDDADTANIAMFVTNPKGIQRKVIYGVNNDGPVSWKFDTNKNRFRINYTPDFKEDGKYHLLIQARDKSGNLSGSNDFEITFEVINKSAITQVINYPNPFTTKTRFVFTLTGARIPDVFTIRIYTVSGKIVKEIHKQELGNIHIGNNITDYYWDGTDNYGSRLANGVYFYQVTVKFNDDIIESIESNADNYFKSGMGKMYLMR